MLSNSENKGQGQGEIYQYLKKYYNIRSNKKKSHVEVFTDIALVEKILDSLPGKVWTNATFKWLDPAAGVGNFLVPIFFRLMKGLQKIYPNKLQRQNHILTHMLFFSEIDTRNINVIKKIFGVKANIFKGNFLNMSFGHEFDIIIGNPPFQEDSSDGNRGGKGKLYEKFVEKSIQCLNPNGYLSFIIPTNLFGGGTPLYEKLVSKQIEFINFNKDLEQYFPTIQQKICFFVLKNTNTNANTNANTKHDSVTIIENQEGLRFNITLKNRPVNPINDWTPTTEKLINKYITSDRNECVYNRGSSLSSYKGTKYCLYYKPKEFIYSNNKALAIGSGIPKVIIYVISISLESDLDEKGECGVGPNIVYYPIKNIVEGRKIYSFLQSEDYKIMAKATKSNRQFIKLGLLFHLNINHIIHKKHKHKHASTRKTSKTRKNSHKKIGPRSKVRSRTRARTRSNKY